MKKTCPICNEEMAPAFSETILNKYKVQYFFCRSCNFLQTEKPYWLEEAYNDAIAINDTGLVQRNILLASKLAVYIYLNLKPRAFYLDIAGGYGMLTRLMRDFGFNYFWSDPYCNNLLAVGFEKESNSQPINAVSAFEVLEHIEYPVQFISEQFSRNKCRTLIFSTELMPNGAIPPKNWRYFSFSTGQHISFFSLNTLEAIAQKMGLHLYSFNNLHVLSNQKMRNSFLTRLLTNSYIAPACAFIIRALLGSKTISDSERNTFTKIS